MGKLVLAVSYVLKGETVHFFAQTRQFQVQVCLVTERAISDTSAFEPCFKGIWASDLPYVLRMDKP